MPSPDSRVKSTLYWSPSKAMLQSPGPTVTGHQGYTEQDMDDLDERVTNCFAGIAEFYEFRQFFQDELTDIKKLLDLQLSPDENGEEFCPITASSPLKGASLALTRKSSMK